MHRSYCDHPDEPQAVVPVTTDKADAIRAFLAAYPNLCHSSALSGVRHDFPDLTMDEVLTVMAGRD
jgi:hypothetical protein